jgi:hypothetical protein
MTARAAAAASDPHNVFIERHEKEQRERRGDWVISEIRVRIGRSMPARGGGAVPESVYFRCFD